MQAIQVTRDNFEALLPEVRPGLVCRVQGGCQRRAGARHGRVATDWGPCCLQLGQPRPRPLSPPRVAILQVLAAVNDADFVAVDGEMSGLERKSALKVPC